MLEEVRSNRKWNNSKLVISVEYNHIKIGGRNWYEVLPTNSQGSSIQHQPYTHNARQPQNLHRTKNNQERAGNKIKYKLKSAVVSHFCKKSATVLTSDTTQSTTPMSIKRVRNNADAVKMTRDRIEPPYQYLLAESTFTLQLT
jgi:hypothetical protein